MPGESRIEEAPWRVSVGELWVAAFKSELRVKQ